MVDNADSQLSKETDRVTTCIITVFTRHGCHLCHVAVEQLEAMKVELDFTIEKIYIDGDEKLEKLYGEQIPVIQIDGEHHDFWRIDPERFRSSLEKHRQRR
ncbi:MAG: glutaredoxin family protein [Candidatus Planktophila sp.]|nr:glutaredoxin family protein [Candidatus Planktophila sp.]